MLKILFYVVVASLYCAQLVTAGGVPTSGAATSGSTEFKWEVVGANVNIEVAMDVPNGGWFQFAYGDSVRGSSHQGPDAIYCDAQGCVDTKLQGKRAIQINPEQNNLNNIQAVNTNGNMRYTMTRALDTGDADDYHIVPGNVRIMAASGSDTRQNASQHSQTIGLPSQQIAGPPPPTPPVAPVAGVVGQVCSVFNAQLLQDQQLACVNPYPAARSCAGVPCDVTECCVGGTTKSAATTPTPGTGNPAPGTGLPGGQGFNSSCQQLMNHYAQSLGKVCPPGSEVAIGSQCSLANYNSCQPSQCCAVELQNGAGIASPAIAVVLASAVVMLAVLF